jgi:hypothetical protein
MITGEMEFDVYVLIQHRSLWQWFLWWSTPSYQILVGQSFASAEAAAKSAELKINSSGGRAIGIAADALICCREKQNIVG